MGAGSDLSAKPLDDACAWGAGGLVGSQLATAARRIVARRRLSHGRFRARLQAVGLADDAGDCGDVCDWLEVEFVSTQHAFRAQSFRRAAVGHRAAIHHARLSLSARAFVVRATAGFAD